MNESKRYTSAIHILVGLTFILNPENKPTVNHIDGIKTNNHVDNLEWSTYGENNQHAYDNNLREPTGKPIIQYSKENREINRFNNILEAKRITNVGYMSIRRCCNNERKTAGGFIWKYL